MPLGRIYDSEGANTHVISFKLATGAIQAVQRHTYEIVCFGDMVSGRLKIDTEATT
jgi:hypothetical protein